MNNLHFIARNFFPSVQKLIVALTNRNNSIERFKKKTLFPLISRLHL